MFFIVSVATTFELSAAEYEALKSPSKVNRNGEIDELVARPVAMNSRQPHLRFAVRLFDRLLVVAWFTRKRTQRLQLLLLRPARNVRAKTSTPAAIASGEEYSSGRWL